VKGKKKKEEAEKQSEAGLQERITDKEKAMKIEMLSCCRQIK